MKIMNLKTLIMAAIITASAALTGCCDKQQNGNCDKQCCNAKIALENIATRVSVRSYQDKSVDNETIEQLLRAGMAAPTAMNRQPWHFVVVNDPEILKDLVRLRNGATAPLAIVVCGNMDKAIEGLAREFWVQDCSAASENILLAANALGLGSVWTGVYPMEERCNQVREILNLPENLIPLNVLVIGYPDGENQPKDKWKEENISWNRFEE